MTEEEGRPPGKRPWLLIPVAVAAAGVGLFLIFGGEGGEVFPAAPALPVLIQPATQVDQAASFVVSGEVEARRTVNVGFRVPGVVALVAAEEGEMVQAGQILAELDDEEYLLNLALAAAEVELATDAHRRATQLFGDAALPESDFIRAGIALRQAELQQEVAGMHVANTRLLAPMHGIFLRRGIQPGEQVGAGIPVFTIVSLESPQIRVGIPEAKIGSMRLGQAVTVRLPALEGVVLEGRVEVIGVLADPVSRTYTVKIGLPTGSGRLLPGMIAEATIQEDFRVQLTTIPGSAVVLDTEGTPTVFVYDATTERVHVRRIRMGALFGHEMAVLSGLDGDEMIVVGGQHRVRDGLRVEVTRIVPGEGGVPSEGGQS